MLYGTAWKKGATAMLVTTALRAGFKGIDTACQPEHYREDLVGDGLRGYLATGEGDRHTLRESLFVQTKFTPPAGQHLGNCPYEPAGSIRGMVWESVSTSLSHLDMRYLDSVLLHSPLERHSDTLEAYGELEQFVARGKIRHIGISNVTLHELERLYDECSVKPAIVQNRFYPGNKWDVNVRRFCREKGMVWQSFWTLTGNPSLLGCGVVHRVAERVLGDNRRREEALYLLVLSLGRGWNNGGGVAVLNGTTREVRMKSDCDAARLVWVLTDDEVLEFSRLTGEDGCDY